MRRSGSWGGGARRGCALRGRGTQGPGGPSTRSVLTPGTGKRFPGDRVLAPLSAGAGEATFSAIVWMNPMNMRERARLARRLFSQERDALARRVLWGPERKLGYNSAPEERPLHGGSVSAWGRRIRRVARGCLWLVSTVVLTAGLVAAALVCADALGPNGPLVLSVALLITVVVLFATTGFGRLAIAAVCAFAAVAAAYWLGLDLLVLLLAFFERGIAQASHWMQLVVLVLVRDGFERIVS